MKTYTLEMQTTVGCPSWCYDFESMSDEEAKSLAKSWCAPDNLPRSCASVMLFDEERAIAEYTITQLVVEEDIG